MKILVDDNGSIRLESNKPLSAEMKKKIESRLEKKAEAIRQIKDDYASGAFDSVFQTI